MDGPVRQFVHVLTGVAKYPVEPVRRNGLLRLKLDIQFGRVGLKCAVIVGRGVVTDSTARTERACAGWSAAVLLLHGEAESGLIERIATPSGVCILAPAGQEREFNGRAGDSDQPEGLKGGDRLKVHEISRIASRLNEGSHFL